MSIPRVSRLSHAPVGLAYVRDHLQGALTEALALQDNLNAADTMLSGNGANQEAIDQEVIQNIQDRIAQVQGIIKTVRNAMEEGSDAHAIARFTNHMLPPNSIGRNAEEARRRARIQDHVKDRTFEGVQKAVNKYCDGVSRFQNLFREEEGPIASEIADISLCYLRNDEEELERCMGDLPHARAQAAEEMAKSLLQEDADEKAQRASRNKARSVKPVQAQRPVATAGGQQTSRRDVTVSHKPRSEQQDQTRQIQRPLATAGGERESNRNVTCVQGGNWKNVSGSQRDNTKRGPSRDSTLDRLETIDPLFAISSVHEHVGRWGQLRALNDIRPWPSSTPSSNHESYASMNDSALQEQLKRHHFPGLDRLLSSHWFREHYTQASQGGCLLKVLVEGLPWTIASVGLSPTGTLYHVYAHPKAMSTICQGKALDLPDDVVAQSAATGCEGRSSRELQISLISNPKGEALLPHIQLGCSHPHQVIPSYTITFAPIRRAANPAAAGPA